MAFITVPLIVTPAGGLAEAVEGPGTGLVAAGTDARSVELAIRRYFSMDRDPFKENIRKEKEILTWEHFSAEITDFVNKVKPKPI
jgi:glycosyltransferase involved in cell wall biosynthesis